MSKKTCTKCLTSKDFSCFSYKNKSSNRLQSQCKICQRERIKIHYYNNKSTYADNNKLNKYKLKNKIFEYKKDKCCTDCWGLYPPYVLDFDHLENKFKWISEMVNGRYWWDRIIKEIEKCEIVCSNCHRERTYKRSI